MSIRVTCPSCSAEFTVNDSFAGKRGSCPRCRTAITVPDEDTDAPSDTGHRRAGMSRGRWIALLAPLGIIVLGVGGVAVYVLTRLAPEVARAEASIQAQRQTERDRLTETTFRRLQQGMTLAEVEGALLGPGSRPSDEDVVRVTEHLRDSFDAEVRWLPSNRDGKLRAWARNGDAFLVAFSSDPSAGGTLIGVLAAFADHPHHGVEPIRLPGKAPAPSPNLKPLDPKTFPEHPEASLTASELAKDFEKYKGWWVVVRGKVKTVADPDDPFPPWRKLALEQDGVPVQFAEGLLDDGPALTAGQMVEIWGRVSDRSDEDGVLLADCLARSPVVEVGAATLMGEFIVDEEQAKQKYQGKTLKVSGVVKKEFEVLKLIARVGQDEWLISCPGLDRAGVRPGDLVTVLASKIFFSSTPSDDWKQRMFFANERVVSISRSQ